MGQLFVYFLALFVCLVTLGFKKIIHESDLLKRGFLNPKPGFKIPRGIVEVAAPFKIQLKFAWTFSPISVRSLMISPDLIINCWSFTDLSLLLVPKFWSCWIHTPLGVHSHFCLFFCSGQPRHEMQPLLWFSSTTFPSRAFWNFISLPSILLTVVPPFSNSCWCLGSDWFSYDFTSLHFPSLAQGLTFYLQVDNQGIILNKDSALKSNFGTAWPEWFSWASFYAPKD